MSASHLVQILLPKEIGSGEPISQKFFEDLLKELTREFGVVTSFLRAFGEGLWRDGSATERDNIAVVEVMTERLDTEFWRALRKRLEAELRQGEIIIRAQQIVQL
jgi:hypothetical protein